MSSNERKKKKAESPIMESMLLKLYHICFKYRNLQGLIWMQKKVSNFLNIAEILAIKPGWDLSFFPFQDAEINWIWRGMAEEQEESILGF